jgi:hypothetical protein
MLNHRKRGEHEGEGRGGDKGGGRRRKEEEGEPNDFQDGHLL